MLDMSELGLGATPGPRMDCKKKTNAINNKTNNNEEGPQPWPLKKRKTCRMYS
jgi:hypothetical protein